MSPRAFLINTVGESASFFVMIITPKKASPASNCNIADISAWGFTPDSNTDKYGVSYSNTRDRLTNGRRVKGHYVIAPTVIKIAKEAFAGADIVTLIIPAGVETISLRMCEHCKKLEHVRIHEGLTKIVAGAFWGCESLSQIEIPASVKSIGGYAFAGCRALTTVIVPSECRIDKLAFPKTCTVLTPEEACKLRQQYVFEH